MAPVATKTVPYVTNTSVKAIRAKPKFFRNSFFKLMVLAEFALTTFIPTAAFTKASENKAEDALKQKKQIVELENRQQADGKQDSTRNEMQKIDIEGGFITAPKGANIIKVKQEDVKITERDSVTYGILLKTADAYRMEGMCIEQRVNNQLVGEQYTLTTPNISYPAFRNAVNVFQQGFTYTYPCDFSQYPQWNAIKYARITSYMMVNLPPIDKNNLTPTASTIFSFLSTFGENVGLLFFGISDPVPIGSPGPTKVLILVKTDLDSNYAPINVRGPPDGWVRALYDYDITSPGNPSRTNWGVGIYTKRYDDQGNGTFKYRTNMVLLGGYEVVSNGSIIMPTFPPSVHALEMVGGIAPGLIVPTKFSLHQNYPNPFNAQTNIGYDVPKNVRVNLGVYDVLGRKVSNLVDAQKMPGTYYQIFDANQLPTGVYFYRMNAGEFTETKKMLLVK